MSDFSVAICTYNGEKRLPLVLERLGLQINIEAINWEVIIIDNNSTDNTANVVRKYQSNWSNNCPLKYYFEPAQGVAFARRRAIQEAQGCLIGFLDDDNLPEPTWLIAAYAFGQLHPKAGAYGSQIRPKFEAAPPPNFHRVACHLVVMERKQVLQLKTYHRGNVAGAGMVIRKQAWAESVPTKLNCLGRVGNSLSAKGEDIEAQAYLRKAGWEIWYNPEMVIYHYLPKWRLEKDYLTQYFQNVGLSRHYLRMLGYSPIHQPFMILLYLVNDLRKIILHFIKYQNVLKTDLIAGCEMIFLLSCFRSPFYVLKKRLEKLKNHILK